MWQIIKKYPLTVAAAVLVHVLFVLVLMISINWSSDKTAHGKSQDVEVIQAEAIDEQQIEQRVERIREAERKKQRQAEQARQRELQRQAELKKKEQEKKRQAALKKKREAEKKRKEEEARRQAELKKQAEEKKRKEEEARKQREKQERQRAEQELKAKMEQEAQQREREASLAASRGEIGKYRRLIKQEVTRSWIIPSSARSGMVCEIMVRLLPSGDVVSVQIIKSSGDPTFDRSVENAVYSAAPLPVPSVESGLFDEFREVIFSFDPKNRL